MTTAVSSGLVSAMIRQLPGPVLRALDAWSQGVARKRAAERQRKWQLRQGRQAPPAGMAQSGE